MASQEDLSAAALLVEKVELEKQLDALQVMLNTVTEQRDGYRAHVESFWAGSSSAVGRRSCR